MEKKDAVEQSKRFTARFPESIFFSIKNIENKMQNVQKNNFYFSFYYSQEIKKNISNENDETNTPRVYIQGLDKLFDMSSTSKNDNPMVGFVQALISSDSDWTIEYKEKTDYGNNCIKISKSNSQSENTNATDPQSEQVLNATIQLIEPYLFDAIFTDYEAIKVTVHFVNFDDNDKHIKQDYIIMAKELAFVDEIKLYDANGNEAKAIPHGEKASLQYSGGNINKCIISLYDEHGEKIKFKDAQGQKKEIIKEADLSTIDRDRTFTLNLEKDDRTTSLKIPVFEAPYLEEISVFDSEGNKAATALDSDGKNVNVIYKGEEATIKWHGGNSESCNSTLYKKNENGQEEEISPDNIKINKDTTFKLVLEKKGCETSTEFTIRCTGWKKEGVCKNFPFYAQGLGNNHFLYISGTDVYGAKVYKYHHHRKGYYICLENKVILFSKDLIKWFLYQDYNLYKRDILPLSINPNMKTNANLSTFTLDLPISAGGVFKTLCSSVCSICCYEDNKYEEVMGLNTLLDFKPLSLGGSCNIKKIKQYGELLFCQIIHNKDFPENLGVNRFIATLNKGIYLFSATSNCKFIAKTILPPEAENANVIYSDFAYNNNKIRLACLCDNNCVYTFEFDFNTTQMSNVKSSFKLEGKQQTRISWVTTDSLYLVLDNYIIKLDENYQATKDNCIYTYISPMDSMKDKNQGVALFGPKDENGKLIIAAIVQDDKETNLWTYKE